MVEYVCISVLTIRTKKIELVVIVYDDIVTGFLEDVPYLKGASFVDFDLMILGYFENF